MIQINKNLVRKNKHFLYDVKKFYSAFDIYSKFSLSNALSKYLITKPFDYCFSCFQSGMFEKRILRAAFKKTFEYYLQGFYTVGSSQLFINSDKDSNFLGAKRSSGPKEKKPKSTKENFEARFAHQRLSPEAHAAIPSNNTRITLLPRRGKVNSTRPSWEGGNSLLHRGGASLTQIKPNRLNEKSSFLFFQHQVQPNRLTSARSCSGAVPRQQAQAREAHKVKFKLKVKEVPAATKYPASYQAFSRVRHSINVSSNYPKLMCADWILETLIEQVKNKRNPRGAINNLINNTLVFMRILGNACPVLGLQICASGRLNNRKKAMAQKMFRCIGTIPQTTLRHKIAYSQGFVRTRIGLIGVKIWVCYR